MRNGVNHDYYEKQHSILSNVQRNNYTANNNYSMLSFYSVNEGDIEQLFRGRQQLGKTCTSITLKFSVEGLDEGNYSALIAVHENDQFYLDAVYRETARENKARIDIALAGRYNHILYISVIYVSHSLDLVITYRKYDFRISDCSECILLEHVNSTPFKIAARIVNSLRRL